MRVTAPALVAAALATGAAIPALGAGAAIGLQDDRMAATSAQDIPTRLEMLKATKTKISRVDLFWATAAPTRPANDRDHTDPAYDWSWADATLCGMVGSGIQPIVTVWNAPGWATGGARGIKGVVILLTLGTGIGSAVFLDGKLLPNTELGHMEIRGKDAEARASERVREEKDLGWPEWAERVGEVIARYAFLFNPDLFIIGGGVSRKAEKFLPVVQGMVKVPVVPAQLQNQAGLIGASLVAADNASFA